MIQDQLSFKVFPYSVEIWGGGELRHSLSIQDATATFRSIELDEHEQATKTTLKKFESINSKVQEFISKDPNKTQEDLSKDEQKLFNDLKTITTQLSLLALRYVKLTVKDWENQKEIIDSIGSGIRNDFFASIRMASFGLTSEGITKKKLHFPKSATDNVKPSSDGGDTKKKKRKPGTRSKKTGSIE